MILSYGQSFFLSIFPENYGTQKYHQTHPQVDCAGFLGVFVTTMLTTRLTHPFPKRKSMPKWLPLTKLIKYLDRRLFLKTVEDKPNPILFDAVIMLKMANLDGQFHLDAKVPRRIVEQPLSMSAQVCSEMVSIAIKGKIHPECGWNHSVACAFRQQQGR